MKTIMLITNIPTPYRIPLFNELEKQMQIKGWKLLVVFSTLGYSRREWIINLKDCRFQYRVLQSKIIQGSDLESTRFTYSGLIRLIMKEKPAAVITNGFSIASMKLWFLSWFFSIPYIIWSGAIIQKENCSDSLLRKYQRKLIVKRASSFVAYGTKAKEYLIFLGADKKKIRIGINTVDIELIANETMRLRSISCKENDGKKHLLYVGALTPRKNVFKLLKVMEILRQFRTDVILDIVGNGEQRYELEKYSKEKNLNGFVIFHGFKQNSELPSFFAQSDCFLFQTDFDIWGLVLNEAMAAGVPCLSSINAGATWDLIKDGFNGFKVDFSKPYCIAEKIDYLLKNRDILNRIGKNGKIFVQEEASIKKSVEGFIEAIEIVVNK